MRVCTILGTIKETTSPQLRRTANMVPSHSTYTLSTTNTILPKVHSLGVIATMVLSPSITNQQIIGRIRSKEKDFHQISLRAHLQKDSQDVAVHHFRVQSTSAKHNLTFHTRDNHNRKLEVISHDNKMALI